MARSEILNGTRWRRPFASLCGFRTSWLRSVRSGAIEAGISLPVAFRNCVQVRIRVSLAANLFDRRHPVARSPGRADPDDAVAQRFRFAVGDHDAANSTATGDHERLLRAILKSRRLPPGNQAHRRYCGERGEDEESPEIRRADRPAGADPTSVRAARGCKTGREPRRRGSPGRRRSTSSRLQPIAACGGCARSPSMSRRTRRGKSIQPTRSAVRHGLSAHAAQRSGSDVRTCRWCY